MTKKQLQQRIEDFARGAGCPWNGDGYFEEQTPETLQRFMVATRSGLGFKHDHYLFTLGWLEIWGDLSRIVEALHFALEEDVE